MKDFLYKVVLPASIIWFIGIYVTTPLFRPKAFAIILSIVFLVSWLIGRRWRWNGYLGTLLAFGIGAILFIVTSPHRIDRIKAWMDAAGL